MFGRLVPIHARTAVATRVGQQSIEHRRPSAGHPGHCPQTRKADDTQTEASASPGLAGATDNAGIRDGKLIHKRGGRRYGAAYDGEPDDSIRAGA